MSFVSFELYLHFSTHDLHYHTSSTAILNQSIRYGATYTCIVLPKCNRYESEFIFTHPNEFSDCYSHYAQNIPIIDIFVCPHRLNYQQLKTILPRACTNITRKIAKWYCEKTFFLSTLLFQTLKTVPNLNRFRRQETHSK